MRRMDLDVFYYKREQKIEEIGEGEWRVKEVHFSDVK